MNFGYSYRTAKITNSIPLEYREYIKDLKSGTNFSGDICYYFSKEYGFGIKYSRYTSSNFMNNAPLYNMETGELLGNGYTEDNISISFIGPGFYGRDRIISDKILVTSHSSLGLINYDNDARVDNFGMIIKSSTIGFEGAIGLDYFLYANFTIGVNISYLQGKLSQIEVNGQRFDMPEAESLNRLDFNFSVKLYK